MILSLLLLSAPTEAGEINWTLRSMEIDGIPVGGNARERREVLDGLLESCEATHTSERKTLRIVGQTMSYVGVFGLIALNLTGAGLQPVLGMATVSLVGDGLWIGGLALRPDIRRYNEHCSGLSLDDSLYDPSEHL